MHLINILFIALALSFDTMAVGAAHGASRPQLRWLESLKISFFFALFQFAMPLAGWLIGSKFEHYLSTYGHWAAFILLTALGAKMLAESFKGVGEKKTDINSWKILVLLSVATSIDALIVGMSFGFLQINIGLAVSVIGVTTFFLTLLSLFLGKKFGERWGVKSEIAGGLILILIGVKVLLSHLLA